ncbi:hypothetical protein OA527_03790 [Pelagibacteraceae bacterium]|nr:hypothetical protein [Pelagibacteraceae bacterium]
MANIFNEVDEDIRKERYKKLWSTYGKYLIGLIISIILIFSINQYLVSKNITDNKKLLDMYFAAAEDIEKSQFELANESLNKIYNDKNSTLAAFSAFKLSESYLKNNNKIDAIALLENIFNNNSLETIYRELALYKYIMINFDTLDISSIENKISIINIKERQLNPYFKELLGIKHITVGDKAKASLMFNELLSSENTPFDLKIRLEKLIQIAS